MMKTFLYITLLLIFNIFFTSCKNDLDVFAPGKETISVYGILNPNQAIQSIKINKVFLTKEDAVVSAKDANTVNYGAGELIVTLERYNIGKDIKLLTTFGNTTKKEIVLTETVITIPNGTFSNEQRLWQTADKLLTTGEYKLIIKKASDGSEIATARTVIIDSVNTAASTVMPFYYLATNPSAFPLHGSGLYPSNPSTNDKGKYINFSLGTEQTIRFKSVLNAKMYDVVMRFHYFDSLTNNTAVAQYVDLNFNTEQLTKTDGVEMISAFKFPVIDFYTNLGAEIAKKSSASVKNRKSNYMEFIVSAGVESLNTFLLVNAPSTTIAQDKPNFSNINGGVGIFSSRSTSRVSKSLWADFIDKIACHPSTFPYLFCEFTSGKPRSTSCP